MKKLTITLAALCLAIAGSLGQGSSDYILNDVSQSVRVTVAVNKKARINTVRAVDRIEVAPSDSAKGYLDIPGAIRFVVWCNSGDGVTVDASLPRGITGPGKERFPRGMLLYRSSESSAFRAFNGKPVTIFDSSVKETARDFSVDLRILLPEGCVTGEYDFPIELSATPR